MADPAVARTRSRCLQQLQALLPPGRAWTREPDAVLTQLLGAAAERLARAELALRGLLDEMDPRTTYHLLPDWERVLGLPDECRGDAQTVPERRDAVLERVGLQVGQSVPFFRELAERLGHDVTITEYQPARAAPARRGALVAGAPVYGPEWQWAWQVYMPNVAGAQWMRAGGANPPAASELVAGGPVLEWEEWDREATLAAGRQIAHWGQRVALECVFRRYAPPYTAVIFRYGG